MTRRTSLVACFSVVALAAVLPFPLSAQTAADSAGIRKAALDYIEGYYTGDAARVERVLHPDLAKRVVRTNPANGRSALENMSAMTLVLITRAMGQNRVPPEARRAEVAILDIFGSAASVRVDAAQWVDYIHMGKLNGEWRIVNVLWEMRPGGGS